jgi:hypothetical protein
MVNVRTNGAVRVLERYSASPVLQAGVKAGSLNLVGRA